MVVQRLLNGERNARNAAEARAGKLASQVRAETLALWQRYRSMQ